MKINDGRITILTSGETTRIEIQDSEANCTFIKIELTPEQFCAALGRQGHVECASMSVYGLDRVGKKMEHKRHEFICPEPLPYDKREEILSAEIIKTLPEGWVSDNQFRSQDTLFKKDGVQYAQTTIRRWV